jgi:uncharacterized protein (UPF0264 family)
MTELLVSVRSPVEAVAAMKGGAAIIDVKEPARGSLGRADTAVMAEILRVVAGRRPVSAALGEWAENPGPIPDLDLAFVKWGLADCVRSETWKQTLGKHLASRSRPRVVLAAYADWECARAPSVEEVLGLACSHPGSVLLIDTHCKDANNPLRKQRPNLLDWLPLAWLEDLCTRARAAQVRIALAGSLGLTEIRTLMPARPDWFAVRGAVCRDGDRQESIDPAKVRTIAELLRNADCSPTNIAAN